MKYVKERNFIVAYDDTGCRGKWDILTNQFYGVRGHIVKTRPVSFNDDSLRNYIYNREDDSIVDVLYFLYNYPDTLTRAYDNERVGQRLEEVISVGLRLSHSSSTFRMLATDTTTLNKECVEYLKENFNNTYSDYAIANYQKSIIYKECFVHVTDEDDKAWVRDIISEVNTSLPADYVISMIRRAITEKVRMAYSSYSFCSLMEDWAECLKNMDEEVKVYHNILTMYAIIKWRYEKYREANYDAILKKNNDKPFLYFEDDKYIARPLLSHDDFHREAMRQDNCVENTYMDIVANGKTYIVGIRLKDDPEMPYITCEVNTDGEIEQFLRRFNNYPDAQDKVFQRKFQNFITETRAKMKE